MLALLLASTLGLVHGLVHAPGMQRVEATPAIQASGGVAQADDPSAQGGHAGSSTSHGWLLKLFDHHEGEQCRLYDQLSGSCALPGVPLIAAAVVLPTAIFLYSLGQPRVLPSALFEARAPPSNH
jgi:hypothetical protein